MGSRADTAAPRDVPDPSVPAESDRSPADPVGGEPLGGATGPGGAVPALRSARYELAAGEGFGVHAHPEHQLVWAPRGVVDVRAGAEAWSIGPTQAAWFPGGTEHDVVARRPASVHCAYVDPWRCPPALAGLGPAALAATPLVCELLRFVGADAADGRARAHAEALLLSLLRPVDGRVVAPRMPRDDRAVVVARALIADPADRRSLEQWGRMTGASARTLARIFVAETGVPFARWRAQQRMSAAAGLLDEGLPVGVVAHRVGYAGPSAFVAAYRRATGRPPAASRRGG
jgi:AraC-like DNA-binding protein